MQNANSIPKLSLLIIYPLLTIGLAAIITVSSATRAQANPFATPDNFTPAQCPSGHKMYYVGANPPAYSPIRTQSLSWSAGNTTNSFTFNETTGNKTFNIKFSALVDLNNNSGGQPPFYGSISGATTTAINLVHDSTAIKTNHVLDVSVDKPISKIGYKIQDLDSTTSNQRTPYIEQVNVAANNGQLTFNQNFHTINTQKNIVTAIKGNNCGAGGCTIDATWSYNLANIALNLKHNNALSETSGAHAVGYSDFYFCLAPPKIIVNKQLAGNRVNNTTSNRDQFSITISRGTTTLKTFDTSGSDQTITNGSSGVVDLAENNTYTITERVINSQNNGDIANYNASYTCTNATTGSTTVIPSGAMTYNAAAKTRAFTLSNPTYGDEISCTITNSPLSYSFSGIVFDDNGAITANDSTRQDVSSTFTSNSSYFNGMYDTNEVGIYHSNLNIALTDCNGSNIITNSPNPQTVSSLSATLGRYSFSVPPSSLVGRSKVCVVETAPTSWDYSVDTTANEQEVLLVDNLYDYKTEKNAAGSLIRNLDFGEVRVNNAALVLIKSQYVHQCNPSLNYLNIPNSSQPTLGFSVNPANNVEPGNCIAYKIDAYNRGHVDLKSIKITDTLQKTPVTAVFHAPKPLGNPTTLFKSTNNTAALGSNGSITSDEFDLVKILPSVSQPNIATLYFNSKYGTQ